MKSFYKYLLPASLISLLLISLSVRFATAGFNFSGGSGTSAPSGSEYLNTSATAQEKAGNLTAAQFIGDGSGLTGVTAVATSTSSSVSVSTSLAVVSTAATTLNLNAAQFDVTVNASKSTTTFTIKMSSLASVENLTAVLDQAKSSGALETTRYNEQKSSAALESTRYAQQLASAAAQTTKNLEIAQATSSIVATSTFSALRVIDESTALGGASTATCSGSGITCTQSGGAWMIFVPGAAGGSSGLEVLVPGVLSSSPTATLAFSGTQFTASANGSTVTISISPTGVVTLDHLTVRTLIVTSSIALSGVPGYAVSQTTQAGFSFNLPGGASFFIMQSSITAEDFFVKLGSVSVETLFSTGNIYASQFFGTWSGAAISTVAAGAINPQNTSASGTPSATTFWRGDNSWATPAAGGGGGGNPLEVLAPGQFSSSPTLTIVIDTPTISGSVSGSSVTLKVNPNMIVGAQYLGWISADNGVAVSTVIGSTPGITTAGYGVPNHQVADSTATAEVWMIIVDTKTIQQNITVQLVTITTGTEPSDIWEGIAVGTPAAAGCGITDVSWVSSTTVILSTPVAGIASNIKMKTVVIANSNKLVGAAVGGQPVLLLKRWNIPPPSGASTRMHQPPSVYVDKRNK